MPREIRYVEIDASIIHARQPPQSFYCQMRKILREMFSDCSRIISWNFTFDGLKRRYSGWVVVQTKNNGQDSE